MQDEFYLSTVTWKVYFSENARDNSYLLFYDDLCTFSKFESCTTNILYSPLWVMSELNFSETAKDNLQLLFYDDMCLVHSASLRVVRRPISILWCERAEYSTFQKALKTTHTSCFTVTFMSLVQSASLRLVPRAISILCYVWGENSIFQKVPETTHSSWFAMNFMTCTFCKFKSCWTCN